MQIVVPAILPFSREDFETTLSRIVALPGISRIQIDVVDGKFASPASWPYNDPTLVDGNVTRDTFLPALDRIEYEIDLMCFNAKEISKLWIALGASRLTFHAESSTDVPYLIESAQAFYGCGLLSCGLVSFGLALNIESDVALVETCLEHIDYVQFMGIARIGRQGQPFDNRVLEKIRSFHSRHPEIVIQVDGGVSLDTAEKLIASGAQHLIMGSALLKAEHPEAVIEKIHTFQNYFSA
jgi:ribulose-phosphate 3-epimerase